MNENNRLRPVFYIPIFLSFRSCLIRKCLLNYQYMPVNILTKILHYFSKVVANFLTMMKQLFYRLFRKNPFYSEVSSL